MKREYSYLNPSMSLARDIEALGQLANSLPMEYFEAKLYRAFPVSEALAYVVPDNLDTTLKKNLQDAEYKADDMDDRLEKINGVEGARFSEDEPVASKNVHGIIYGKEDAEFSYSERGKNYVEQIHNSGMLWAKAQNQEGTTSQASREYAGIVRRGLESRCVERVRRGVEKRTDSEGRLISDSNLKKLNGSVVLTDNYEYIPVYHAKVTWPSKLRRIGRHAFCRNSICEIELPQSLIFIGDMAFWNNGIEKIKLPEYIEFIGESAISDYSDITVVRGSKTEIEADRYAKWNKKALIKKVSR